MRFVIVAGALLAGLPVAPSHGQTLGDPDLTVCSEGIDRHAPSEIEKACTAALASSAARANVSARADALAARSQARLELADFAGARADAEAILALRNDIEPTAPFDAYVYELRAHARSGLGDKAGAVADVDRALAFPVDAEYQAYLWLLRGLLHQEMKQYRTALADYDMSNSIKPSVDSLNSSCWTRAAYLNAEIARARKECDAALALTPDAHEVIDSSGMVELRSKHWAKAWAEYDRALRIKPDYASALYGRGLAAMRLGRKAQGRADLAAATRLDAKVAQGYREKGLKP